MTVTIASTRRTARGWRTPAWTQGRTCSGSAGSPPPPTRDSSRDRGPEERYSSAQVVDPPCLLRGRGGGVRSESSVFQQEHAISRQGAPSRSEPGACRVIEGFRGATRLCRGAPNVGGVGGHFGAPISLHLAQRPVDELNAHRALAHRRRDPLH